MGDAFNKCTTLGLSKAASTGRLPPILTPSILEIRPPTPRRRPQPRRLDDDRGLRAESWVTGLRGGDGRCMKSRGRGSGYETSKPRQKSRTNPHNLPHKPIRHTKSSSLLSSLSERNETDRPGVGAGSPRCGRAGDGTMMFVALFESQRRSRLLTLAPDASAA
jgi:hypothetical protein